MRADPSSLIRETALSLYLADQIDLMHLAVAALSDAVNAGETDLFLEQPGKDTKQKKLYLEKLVAEVRSPELRALLRKPLEAADIEFFFRKPLTEFLADLAHAVEKIQVIRLTVAVEFKPSDIREMAGSLSGRLERPVAFELTVDPSLIGGVVIQHGNYITDYSLRSRLARFRDEWKAAAIETATGR